MFSMYMGPRYLNYDMTEIEIEPKYTYKILQDNLLFFFLKIAKKISLIPSIVRHSQTYGDSTYLVMYLCVL